MEAQTTEKPKQDWGRVIKRSGLGVLGIAVGLIAIFWLSVQYQHYQAFKHDLIEFENIKIGAPMAEVRYALVSDRKLS